MKYHLLPILCLMLANAPAMAIDAKGKRGSSLESEPIKCYKTVWGSKDHAGLGLTAGLSVTLCNGTENSTKTANCFAQAWAHPDDGGLGLTAGQAVALCKPSSSE